MWSGNINLGVVPNEISKKFSVDKVQERSKILGVLITLGTGQSGRFRGDWGVVKE